MSEFADGEREEHLNVNYSYIECVATNALTSAGEMSDIPFFRGVYGSSKITKVAARFKGSR